MNRIVVIDDEYIVVEGIKTMIGRAGLNYEIVGFAYDGLSGLEVIEKEKPDIVITDIRIPGMDGLSLIETARELFTDMIFIIISGYYEFEYAKRALSLGVKGYIDKPITIHKILEVFDKIEKEQEQTEKERNRVYSEARKETAALKETNEHFFKMLQAVVAESPENVEKECLEVLNSIHFQDISQEEYGKECFKLLCVLSGALMESEIQMDMKLGRFYRDFQTLTGKEETKKYVEKIIHDVKGAFEAKNAGSGNHVIFQLLQYINNNYQRDIGLNELADMVRMNPAYLSWLFKEEMGTSYIKYLTSLRIRRAKEFLLQGYKIHEVSEKVGYHNYRYFCEIFKKMEGKTPNEYRGHVKKI